MQLNPDMDPESISAALEELDADGDGEISFAEFEVWWKGLMGDDEEEEEKEEKGEKEEEEEEEAAGNQLAKPGVDLDKAETRYGQTPLYIAAVKGARPRTANRHPAASTRSALA